MVHLLLTGLLAFFPIKSIAEDIVDTRKYDSLIPLTLKKNGVDCEIEKFKFKTKAEENLIFSIECTKSSYLNDVEITCTRFSEVYCKVSRY